MKKYYKLAYLPTKIIDFSITGVKLNPKYDYSIKDKMIALTSRGMKKIKNTLTKLKQ